VSEADLISAQLALQSEIQPEVNALLNRVEAYLDKLDRREQSLIAKCELQRGRLSSNKPAAKSKGTSSSTGGTAVSALKASQVRQKKDRLSYAIDRLQLQATQTQRQLRKSLAAPPLDDLD
jgi:DASH complex subunit SPC19